jgi:sigma-B regulation protein RsbU (phosphoserine phosphatase)
LEEVFYQRQEMILHKGDTLFLYTDGVTEAMNEKGELFGDERLQRVLSTLKGGAVEAVVDGVMNEVKGFSRGAPRSDDIAMVAVKFHGPQTEA